MNRLETLRQLVAQDPGNSFVRYGLAMELVNSGDLRAGAAEFEAILAGNPDYAAAYFHGGQTYEKLGELDRARQTYRSGIEATTRTGDAHTRSELQAALDILGD
ncbi:MAG: tetratricopeptide repeat protein [Bryobacteraceae bacterium]|nr:tetratricopeptide repeat protein [Bryobacteraceae bacterium]